MLYIKFVLVNNSYEHGINSLVQLAQMNGKQEDIAA